MTTREKRAIYNSLTHTLGALQAASGLLDPAKAKKENVRQLRFRLFTAATLVHSAAVDATTCIKLLQETGVIRETEDKIVEDINHAAGDLSNTVLEAMRRARIRIKEEPHGPEEAPGT